MNRRKLKKKARPDLRHPPPPPPAARTQAWIYPACLAGILLGALLIRLLYISQARSTPIAHGLACDTDYYAGLAKKILSGDFAHPDFNYLNPVYPFFLAGIYGLFGQSVLAATAAQALLDTLSCLLVTRIAAQLMGRKAALLAGLVYAGYGLLIFYSGLMLSTTLTVFLFTASIAAQLAAGKTAKPQRFLLAGIVLGLAVLTRPNALLFLLFLPAWFFTVLKARSSPGAAARCFIVLLAGLGLVFAANAARNRAVSGRLTPFTAHGGLNFYIGNNPEAEGIFMCPPGISRLPIEQVKTSIALARAATGLPLSAHQVSNYWLSRGLRFIREQPRDAAALYIKKAAVFWRGDEPSLNIDYGLCATFVPLLRLPFFSFGLVAPLALVGLVFALRRDDRLLLLLFVAAHMAATIMFFVSDRYRLPAVPFLIILAVLALQQLAGMLRGRLFVRAAAAVAAASLAWACVNAPTAALPRPTLLHLQTNIGKTYIKMGAHDRAVSVLQEVLARDGGNAPARYSLGVARALQGRLDEAIAAYEAAISLAPDEAEYHNNLGNAWLNKDVPDRAAGHFTRALQLDPGYARAYFNLGNARIRQGRPREAVAAYQKSIELDPAFPTTHANLGIVYLYNFTDYARAAACIQKARVLGETIQPEILEKLRGGRDAASK
ncbi:tetratricopeptide repeat protein [Thermodesulfobacteriota bacterium]